MWIFILLYILGLNVSQATGQGNSTQMYYAKLTIDNNVIENITEILRSFVSNTNLRVDNLEKTTICQNVSKHAQCTCEPHYRWSDEVCKSNPDCCGNKICSFPKESHMCVSNTAVTIIGSINLKGPHHHDCLAKQTSTKFQNCHSRLLKELKGVFSTLSGFDTITVGNYRVGSIIADFKMTIARDFMTQDLINKSIYLSRNLSTSVILETTGVVNLSMPSNPVCYHDQHVLKCTVQDNLNTLPVWQLKRRGEVFDITNGTESEVTFEPLATEVKLKNLTELWEGEYTCIYPQISEFYSISHQASAVMDIALLPNIDINMDPAFPRCRKTSDLMKIKVQCEIKKSDEKYNVTFTSPDITAEIKQLTPSSSERLSVYVAETVITCDSSTVTPQVTCTFENRCLQKRSASISINIIHANDRFCAAEGEWGNTKAGFTAVLKCKDATGKRQRECKNGTTQATWEKEVSVCVNTEVSHLLYKANIVDIGLGSVDRNAAQIFSVLENVTYNSETINTFANMNASVQVLHVLSQKQMVQPNTSTADDFLKSSSNLLDESLSESWQTEDDKDNISLAEIYLSSVEHLIQVSNITGVTRKKNLEVATKNCSEESQCTNKVFNVTVVLDSSNPGSVKTAGFVELGERLPNNDDNVKPNSIVVSTTTENKELDSVEIKIDFELLEPRPPNVKIQCVSWDNSTRSWSESGCKWGGPSKEGRCVCSHLSSFAILMSKYPVQVPWITEITVVGLSVSVISLVISLVIEVIVWSAVVKTNTLYLRHTAHINISICLLVADICFLASPKPHNNSPIWCKTFVVLKHFCYLSMFFWMFCLSSMLLHQTVFLFHNVSKKSYLRFSFVIGYVCPLLIVSITLIANKAGTEGFYFSRDTCWLTYAGFLKGSIHTFVIPVGIIVFINVFSMMVVIMKLLDRPKNTETPHEKEKMAAVTVIRSVVLLTPVFGLTWAFGFALMLLDLTTGSIAFAVNYAFTLLNAFQGLFILLTTCLGDKLTREALLLHLKKRAPASMTDSSTTLESTWKK